ATDPVAEVARTYVRPRLPSRTGNQQQSYKCTADVRGGHAKCREEGVCHGSLLLDSRRAKTESASGRAPEAAASPVAHQSKQSFDLLGSANQAHSRTSFYRIRLNREP